MMRIVSDQIPEKTRDVRFQALDASIAAQRISQQLHEQLKVRLKRRRCLRRTELAFEFRRQFNPFDIAALSAWRFDSSGLIGKMLEQVPMRSSDRDIRTESRTFLANIIGILLRYAVAFNRNRGHRTIGRALRQARKLQPEIVLRKFDRSSRRKQFAESTLFRRPPRFTVDPGQKWTCM